MTLYLSFAFFLLGAIVASFVGVVAARLNTGEGIVRGRSRCDACGKPLDVFDLVPILSYVAGGGRARCCGVRISWRAPLMELVLGALYVLAYRQLGFSSSLLVLLAALAVLLALVLYDLAHMIVPTALLLPLCVLSAIFAWLVAPDLHALYVVAGVAAIEGLIILLLHVGSRGRAMGFADAPLTLALALIAGPEAISGFVYTFWLGAVIGIVLLLGRPRGSRMGVEVPFAPYLALGFLLAYFTQWDLLIHIAGLLLWSSWSLRPLSSCSRA